MDTHNNISLFELAEIEKMSVRALNICYTLGLDTLNKILEFYQSGGNFLKVRNCGQRTENELIFVCKKYLNSHSENRCFPELPFIDQTVETINNFNPFKKAALNRHFEYLFSKLTVRAKNGIVNHFDKTPSINELIETIYSMGFTFYDIRNIGEKSASELVLFKDSISAFTEILQALDDNQLSQQYTKLVIKTSFGNFPNNIDTLLEAVFDCNGKIKLFKLLDLLIKFDLIFKNTEKEIFYSNFSTANKKSLQLIASNLGISNERTRQIKVTLQKEIKSYFQFIFNLREEDLPNYGINSVNTFMIIDNDFSSRTNANEDVDFNTFFYSSILSLFLEKSHTIFGHEEALYAKHKLSKTKRFTNCYLIENEVYNSFDFGGFSNSVNELLNERFTEDHYLHFQGYISQFSKQGHKTNYEGISEICESILFNEFELVVNTDGYLIFERTTKRQLTEYIIEALQCLNEMTKVENIVKEINNKHPHLQVTEQSVRASLQRDKTLFIYVGRTSTYGLKKWQEERTNLKGGTIRDIVEEYLQIETEPKHISEITIYVRKYRNTNEYSIKTNLDLDNSARFHTFPGEFIGLKSKQYGNVDRYRKTAGSHFRSTILRKMNGWYIAEVINYFVNRFNYHPTQVKALIDKKANQGEFTITPNNKLKYESN